VDSDTLNVVLKTAAFSTTPTISGVENINVAIDAFAGTTTTFDAVNVTGATITLSSTKLGFNGEAGVTNVGDNNVTAGQNVDTLEVAGLEAGVVNTGSATTVDITALTAGAGEEINLTINGDIDATITFNTPAIQTLNLVATAASVVTLNAASAVAPANLTIAGSGDLSIDTDAANVSASTITGVNVLNITTAGAVDAENFTVNSIEISDAATSSVTNANGQVVDLSVADADLTVSGDSTTGAATTLNVTADQTGSAGLTVDGVDTSIINLSDVVTQIAASLTIEGEATVNVLGDVTINNLVASNTTDTAILAGTGDVTLTTTNLQSIDASGLTGALVVTATTAGEAAIVGGTGDNDITLADVDSAFTGQAGNDTVDATAVTTGDVAVESGDGDDTVKVAAPTATIAFDGGTGTDTLSINNTGGDISGASVSLVSVEAIQVTDNDATVQAALTATVSASTLSGESFTVNTAANNTGVAVDTATITVDVATTDTVIDLSGLTLTNVSSIGVVASANTAAVSVTGTSTADTITGTTLADTIVGGAGDDVINAGGGADTLTGDAGADTFVFGTGESVEGAVASITDFNTSQFDVLDLVGGTVLADVAGTSVTAADADGGTVTASINSGIMTLAGADAANIDTFAEWVDAAEIMIGASSDALAFEFNGNTYAIEGDGFGATDNLVELTGITGLTGVDITAGVDTLVIA
jgi:hypothetical protein